MSQIATSRIARALAVLAAALIALNGACSRGQYTKVTRTDGTTVIGALVAIRPDVVILQTRAGQVEIPRSQIRSIEEPTLGEITDVETSGAHRGGTSGGATSGGTEPGRDDGGPGQQQAQDGSAAGSPDGGGSPGGGTPGGGSSPSGAGASSGAGGSERAPSGAGRVAEPGEIGIPAGTAITVAFDAALASDTARVEQPVAATLKSPIVINGARVAPAGSRLAGRVTDVASARLAGGRGRIAIRFHTLTIDTRVIPIDAPALPLVAQVFTREDKRKVGWGAAAGAALGGIVSRTKKGLGIGAAAGAGGTAAAVGLRNDVRIAAGTPMRLHLTQPVFVPAP